MGPLLPKIVASAPPSTNALTSRLNATWLSCEEQKEFEYSRAGCRNCHSQVRPGRRAVTRAIKDRRERA
jgi:hypothetical protein